MAVVDYYRELSVSMNASAEEIRSAYRKLAMRWHPDRWTRVPQICPVEEAKQKFQGIQEAYSVLSDRRRRRLYDAGLYDKAQEDDEGMADFVEEIFSLITKEQKRAYSLEELQDTLADMMNGRDSREQWFTRLRPPETPCAKRARSGGCPAATSQKSRCSRMVKVGGAF